MANNSDTFGTLALAFLTWLDALERLDTLLLEAIHIQQNIVYQLRAPTLYQPLHYEQDFLWLEKDLEKLHDPQGVLLDNTEALAKEWIVLYPTLDEPIKTNDSGVNTPISRKDELEEKIADITRKLVHGGYWNREQREHYCNLSAIQRIKRIIFRDKLVLCRYGLRIFYAKDGKNTISLSKPDELWKFLLLRCVILARARVYVSRLGDHQEIFTRNQDIGLQDHPRPSVWRRREQAIYSVHLAERCRDIAREMHLLMMELTGKKRPKSQSSIFHHWRHDFTSRSYSFRDELEKSRSGNITFGPYQHYVNTSYWMPERPDLKSVIAHEVAHSIVREWWNDLLPQDLDRANDSFSRLLKQLKQCLDIFQVEEYSDRQLPFREIAVDLITSATQGPAYLYALFLELLGAGLEDMFASGDDMETFELAMLDYLDGAAGPYSQIRDWYYRLHVVCTWLEEIEKSSTGVFASEKNLSLRLIESSKKILDGLHSFLEVHSPPGFKIGNYWRTLKDRLCQIIKQSPAIRDVRQWRDKRDSDHLFWDKTKTCWYKGKRQFPRFTRPLHPELRNFLAEDFQKKKAKRVKEALSYGAKEANELSKKHIKTVYGLEWEDGVHSGCHTGDQPPKLVCKDLFERIYDIPWQCAFMRALDFIHQESKIRPKTVDDWFTRMHNNAALGRGMYQLALDFYMQDLEDAQERLVNTIRLLNLGFISNKLCSSCFEKIKEWHGTLSLDDVSLEVCKNEVEEISKELNDLLEDTNVSKDGCANNDYLEKEKYREIAQKHSPVALVMALKQLDREDMHRKLISVQGFKLKQLLERIKSLETNSEPLSSELDTLKSFLEIHDKKSDWPVFNKDLLDAFKISDDGISTHMLTRICVAGSYEEYDQYTMNRKEIFSRERKWKNVRNDQCLVLLGRYDLLFIREVEHMARYGIPRFGNSEERDDGKAPTHFVRREMALPVRLGCRAGRLVENENILAFISINLRRTSARLDFLTRLLKISKTNPATTAKNLCPSTLNELKGYFDSDKGDHAFLCDGWGDILLVFCGDPAARLEHIFTIQSILFEDFQVDRTELFLTPSCIQHACSNSGNFRVSMIARLMEDRTLDQENKNFVEFLQNNTSPFRDCPIIRIPGLMDYVIPLDNLAKSPGNNLLDEATSMHEYEKIDRIQTNIGKVEQLKSS